jgi:hypothetical protein
MIVRPDLVLLIVAVFVFFPSRTTLAQSELLWYRDTGVGIEVGYATGDDTERVYETAATLSFEGVLDLTAALGWAWLENGQSSGHDAKAYSLGAAVHPWKPSRDTGVQARLGIGYSSLKFRGNRTYTGYSPDDSRTAFSAEGSVYLAPRRLDLVALVPMVTIGKSFVTSGGNDTYYSAGMAFRIRKGSGIAFLRVTVLFDNEETLLAASIGAIGSMGRGWD